MTAPTVGSLCSGYGGLDRAVEQFFGARTAWFSEFDAAPSKVLAHHWPEVPNLGDMTAIEWSQVEPVDIVTGGTPCQDLSAAGARRGMTEGTRSNLWVQMREAIATIRPRVVVWENVRGAYSARADSDVESEQGLLGVAPDRPALRALGRVLGDLSELGFDAEWVGLRASDAGAPHARFRVFVIAYAEGVRLGDRGAEGVGRVPAAAVTGDLREPAYADNEGRERFGRIDAVERDAHRRDRALGSRAAGEPAAPAQDADVAARGERGLTAPGEAEGGRPRADAGRRGGAPAPDTERGGGGEGNRHAGLGGEGLERAGLAHERGARPGDDEQATDWGPYEPAIRRWESVLGRVAPAPTNPDGKNGAHRLAPEFVEWMMGAEAGWVTDPVIGLTRNQMLQALGNGVVTQQAELALSIAWGRLADVRTEVAA